MPAWTPFQRLGASVLQAGRAGESWRCLSRLLAGAWRTWKTYSRSSPQLPIFWQRLECMASACRLRRDSSCSCMCASDGAWFVLSLCVPGSIGANLANENARTVPGLPACCLVVLCLLDEPRKMRYCACTVLLSQSNASVWRVSFSCLVSVVWHAGLRGLQKSKLRPL